MRDIVAGYLRECAKDPVIWGKTDCAQGALGFVRLVSGREVSLGYGYDSETEAKRIVVAVGGLEAAVSSVLGSPSRDLSQCSDGDIVLSAFKDLGHVLGIALPRVFFIKTEPGPFIPIDLTLAICFWKPCPA